MPGSREALIEKLDPVSRTTNRINAWEDAVAKEAPLVAREVYADTDFLVNSSVEEIEARVLQGAEKRAIQNGVFPPPKMFELPRESNPVDQFISTAQLPITQPLSPIIQSMNQPDRPRGTADLVGLQSVQDLATGQGPKMDDMGETLRNILPTVFAVSPQARGKSVFPILRAVRSFARAELGALIGGGLSPIFEEAERLRQEQELSGSAMSRSQAFSQAATKTPGIVDEMFGAALGDAALEAVTAGGAFGARAAREKVAKFLDVDNELADSLINTAANHNIDLSVRDVSMSPVVRRSSQSFGRFPFVNKIFVDETKRVSDQFGGAFAETLSAVAPEVKSFAGRGAESTARRVRVANRDLLNGASEAFVAARSRYGNLYAEFERLAQRSGATVAPANTSIVVNEKLSALKRVIGQKKEVGTGLLDAAGRPVSRTVISKPGPRGDLARVKKELDLLRNPEDRPSVLDFRGSMQRLQGLVDEVGGADTIAGQIVVDVLTSMRRDFSENLADANGIALTAASEVLMAKRAADSFFINSVDIFGGRAGNLIREIDKQFGEIALTAPMADNSSLGRRAGSVDPIETINQLFDSGEPSVVNDLHRMLTTNLPKGQGEALFRKSYGVYLAGKFNRAIKTTEAGFNLTDTKVLRKELGLDDPTSAKFAATSAAFKRSGVSVTELQQVLALADKAFEFGIPDVSQLITRRLMLGGIGSGARTFAPTTGLLGNIAKEGGAAIQILDRVATSAAVFLTMRGGARRINDPRWLREYRLLLSDKPPARIRFQALNRLLAMDTGFLVFDNLVPGDFQQSVEAGDVRRSVPDRTGPPQVGTVVNAPLPQQGVGGVR